MRNIIYICRCKKCTHACIVTFFPCLENINATSCQIISFFHNFFGLFFAILQIKLSPPQFYASSPPHPGSANNQAGDYLKRKLKYIIKNMFFFSEFFLRICFSIKKLNILNVLKQYAKKKC